MSIFIRLLEKIPKLGGSIELFIFCTHINKLINPMGVSGKTIISIDKIAHSLMELEGCQVWKSGLICPKFLKKW